MWKKGFCIFLFYLSIANAKISEHENKVRYENFKVYEVEIKNEAQRKSLQIVESRFLLNYWREAREYGDSSDVMIPPSKQTQFEEFLIQNDIGFSIKISDVQRLVDAQKPKSRSTGLEWTDYHTLDEINEWLDLMISRYPNIVIPFTIGKSYEGREIKGIKISYKTGNKAVFIESNIHAREWITSAAITYIIDEFLVSRNPSVRDIAENTDWYIIPVLNVDGFAFSHTTDRLWRKSRLPSDPSGNCIGTDLNRNFNFLWMLVGASSDPCSQTYAGPYAESDPEIKQLVEFISTKIPEDTIKIYISLHSYGQYVLSPWGHTDEEFPAHFKEMMEVAKGYSDALYRRYNTNFTYGSSSTTLYKVSGSGKEWAYGVKGIKIPYTIELRDKGQFGFVLPAKDIIPVGREVLDGFVGMIHAARSNGILN